MKKQQFDKNTLGLQDSKKMNDKIAIFTHMALVTSNKIAKQRNQSQNLMCVKWNIPDMTWLNF